MGVSEPNIYPTVRDISIGAKCHAVLQKRERAAVMAMVGGLWLNCMHTIMVRSASQPKFAFLVPLSPRPSGALSFITMLPLPEAVDAMGRSSRSAATCRYLHMYCIVRSTPQDWLHSVAAYTFPVLLWADIGPREMSNESGRRGQAC
jgi:hypothetical protein